MDGMIVARVRERRARLVAQRRAHYGRAQAARSRQVVERRQNAQALWEARPLLTGVVLTTHGNTGAYARMAVYSILRHLKSLHYMVLFINGKSDDPIHSRIEANLSAHPKVDVVRVDDDSGGLTYTWNKGIAMCRARNCSVIALSNNDIFVDASVNNLIQEAHRCPLDALRYYGPVTNNPGPAECNKAQKFGWSRTNAPFVLTHNARLSNLNGFFMAFPTHVLEKIRLDTSHVFDPSLPYDGAEVEWYSRLVKRGGYPVVVPRAFVYHYKNRAWRQGVDRAETACLYTINTGGYESSIPCRRQIPGADMLYLSDNPRALAICQQHGWTPMYLLPEWKASSETKLLQRTAKTQPHMYLPSHYQASIYIDGNLEPLWADSRSLLKLLGDTDLVCWAHPDRTKVADEVEEVIAHRLERRANTNVIQRWQREAGFPDEGGLTETCILVRRHAPLEAFSNEWKKCISTCRRDQCSFDYLLWKHRVKSVKLRYKTRPIRWLNHSGNISGRAMS